MNSAEKRCLKCGGIHFGDVEGNCPLSPDYVPSKPWPKPDDAPSVAAPPHEQETESRKANGVEVGGDLTAASGPNADPDSPPRSARYHNPSSVRNQSPAGVAASSPVAAPQDEIGKEIIVDTEVAHLQRNFESLGTISNKTSEPLMRAAFNRVWDSAYSLGTTVAEGAPAPQGTRDAIRYYRDILRRIANGYSSAQTLAAMALQHDFHQLTCASLKSEQDECDCGAGAPAVGTAPPKFCVCGHRNSDHDSEGICEGWDTTGCKCTLFVPASPVAEGTQDAKGLLELLRK